MKPLLPTLDAVQLLFDGSMAFAKMEQAGIKIDVDRLDQTIKDVAGRITELETRLRTSDVYATWRKRFRDKANLGSRPQLAEILFDVMKLPYPGGKDNLTATKRYRTDDEILAKVDLPFVKDYQRLMRLGKLKSTYLVGLKREVVDGFVHGVFNLHTVVTFRSSADSPNLQNQAVRDPEIAEILRRCFIARSGRRLVEIDLSATEFKGAACFWSDAGMIEYASNPDKDVHRDQAMDLFCCEAKQINKRMRYLGKNGFVFPTLYGSYYVKCAAAIWEELDGLTMEDGKTLVKEWLASKGITRLGLCDSRQRPKPGTFEYHVKEVEERFFARFPTFAEKKEKWWKDYQKTGAFRMPSGFVCSGNYSRNFLLNSPIQGSMYHCLLKAHIKLQRLIEKKGMKTLLVAQIHDCVLADVPENELQRYLKLAKWCMTDYLRKCWDWLTVPLGIEVDVTPVEGSWWEKAAWHEVDGKWISKGK